MLIILRVAQGKAWPEGTKNLTDSKANVQSPFVAENGLGFAQTSSNPILFRTRNTISETVILPRETQDNATSESPRNSFKGIVVN